MKIALIMPPMDAGPNARTAFKALHELAKGKPHWTPLARRLTADWRRFVDFEDYPKGLVAIGSALDARHELRIFNFINRYQRLADVVAFAPDVVGITCSTGSNLIWIDDACRALKRRLDCVLVLGGPHVTLDPLTSLETTPADFVCLGEVDGVVDRLFDHIDGRTSKLPREGVGYYRDGSPVITPPAIVADLAELPSPNLDLLELDRYLSIGVEASRGCSRACDFCYLSAFAPRCRWRPRPIEQIVDELRQIDERVDLREKKIYFLDTNFTVDRRRVGELCDALVAAGLTGEKWVATDFNLDGETIESMLAAGFHHIYVGVESGAASFIERYAKTGSRERVLDFFRLAKGAGLSPQADLVLMAPGETDETLDATWELCREIAAIESPPSADRSRGLFAAHTFKVFPNTGAAHRLAANGFRPPRSLRAWGELYLEMANGDFSALGDAVRVSRFQLHRTLWRFARLNFATYVWPRLRERLRQRLGRWRPAARPAAGGRRRSVDG